VLVSVSDLDRSIAFYEDVLHLRTLLREDKIAILRSPEGGSSTVALREALRGATRQGQHVLGVRMFVCDVGSLAELGRTEERLRALDAFERRQYFDEAGKVVFVAGRDPDRLPLIFMANVSGEELSPEEYRHGLPRLYGVDI
jgi:catechol 2,3-dioxygenase-like lactoylglutathione lyase family enzyme